MPLDAPPLPALSPDEAEALSEFRWLMVGDGHDVDLDRLRHDRAYARGCLALARGSTTPALQGAAARLAPWLRARLPPG
ncbi:hypothetical protein [Aquabacterium sp. OR-4]|uniref:hypothetical protein n=1 Tax=Aquabacterium sp. OR-4 TaxID=2978127 RepID=UPI0028C55253|nr:hypothetical protein [Aquabacterium sp. OR-4]MDT7836337.1 hypothetical protein [Aquabacterium sp. OR-4]